MCGVYVYVLGGWCGGCTWVIHKAHHIILHASPIPITYTQTALVMTSLGAAGAGYASTRVLRRLGM